MQTSLLERLRDLFLDPLIFFVVGCWPTTLKWDRRDVSLFLRFNKYITFRVNLKSIFLERRLERNGID